MKLVDNWKQAWKWFSVHCMVTAAAVQGVWATLPDDMKAAIPASLIAGLTIALLFVGVGGRLVKQGGPDVVNPHK